MMKCGDRTCNACYTSDYELDDILFLYLFLRRNECRHMGFIDVGAHVGLYVNSLAAMCHKELPQCRMLSIEPDVSVLDSLDTNTMPHPIMNVALWNEPAKLYLHKNGKAIGYVDTNASDMPVVGTTLDLLRRTMFQNLEVLALKIDTEGSESLVLQGARETLNRVVAGAVVVEMSMAHLRRYSTGYEDIVTHLAGAGFKPMRPAVIEEVRKGFKRNVHFVKEEKK